MHHPDILGKALQAYYQGDHETKLWTCSNMDGEVEMPLPYFFRQYDDMPELEHRALELAEGRVLELGAGAGCHALVLQAAGQEVHALDISAGACAVMADRGVQHIHQADVFEFAADGRFDSILMLMNGIGIAGNIDGLRRLMKSCYALLNPGGKVIFDSSDVIGAYIEDDGSFAINLNDRYYGVVDFYMSYAGERGPDFEWIYVDFGTIIEEAEDIGFQAEMVYISEDDQYLAVLHRD